MHRDISLVCGTSEISYTKTMNIIFTDDHHKLVFMPYYYWLEIDFNGLSVYNFKEFTGETRLPQEVFLYSDKTSCQYSVMSTPTWYIVMYHLNVELFFVLTLFWLRFLSNTVLNNDNAHNSSQNNEKSSQNNGKSLHHHNGAS